MKSVLENIRVLDFSRFIAGPYCGMLLADMGAEVIRIDRPGGEEDRTIGLVAPNGENLIFPCYARNKKGITLNLFSNDHGSAILADLVRQSDVVLHSFSPEAAKMAGLIYENLAGINPKIIVTAISCFGSTGPYANRTGFDFIAQAMSGAMKIGGYPDKPPIRAFMNPNDHGTGAIAAFGTMVALRHRDQTGEGQLVDLSLMQTAMTYVMPMISEAEVLGRIRPFIGNRSVYMGPTDLYQCKDGYVFVATVMNSLWRRLARLIGHEELIDDPDLQTDYQRYENRDRIDPLVAEWIAGYTVAEVLEKLEAARIPCGPLRGVEEVLDDPHIRSENMVEFMDFGAPGLEKVPTSGIPARLSKTPGSIARRHPRVGEHNSEIYEDLLGYGPATLNDLREKGVI
ncbi:MAG: CoA transferase [Proteobacteria bacterium]|nr:CoA transferase [Pseudomonadota bacterium]